MKKRNGSARLILSLFGVLICVLLVPILAMNLTIIVKSYLNPNEIPDFLGIKPFIVVTGSMEGTIDGGDLIITKVVEPEALEVGDIIAYSIDTSVITHRIIEETQVDGQPAFITKGDANNIEDQDPVTFDQIESIYLFRIAGLGNVAMFMQTPVGMLVFIGIPLCCFILYDIIWRRFQAKKDSKKDDEMQSELENLRAQLDEQKKDNTEEAKDNEGGVT